jgi:D-aspartate ligase
LQHKPRRRPRLENAQSRERSLIHAGRHDASVVAAVREAGFRAAVTTRAGVATRDSDPYRLPRIEVRRFDSRLRLGLRLAARARSASGSPDAPHEKLGDGEPSAWWRKVRYLHRQGSARPTRSDPPSACVLGGIDLVRALGLGGIRSVVIGAPGEIARYSRYTQRTLNWVDPWNEPDAFVDRLMSFGSGQPVPPVLYYDGDGLLLMVSRYRDVLAQAFRFVVADATLVEDLVDKKRFRALARRLDLPVPRMLVLSPRNESPPSQIDLDFPVVLKPRVRPLERWYAVGAGAKAVVVPDRTALLDLWPRLRALGIDVVAQEYISGAATRIESYHAYIDGQGETVAAFTGRKIRTYPEVAGHSTSVEITSATDVLELGADLTTRLSLRGVAKFDFIRDRNDRPHLLEVNPRFSLWHYPGAKAGINLPALVYDDLTGRPRRRPSQVRHGTRWYSPVEDLKAARQEGVRFLPWLAGTVGSGAVAWQDPMPIIRGIMWPRVSGRLRGTGRRASVSAARDLRPGAGVGGRGGSHRVESEQDVLAHRLWPNAIRRSRRHPRKSPRA